MRKLMNAILKNDTIAFTVFAVLTLIGYFFGMKLIVASKIVLALTVVTAIITVAFNTYHFKDMKEIIPNYTFQYVCTMLLMVTTLIVAITLPTMILGYSLVIAIAMPAIMFRAGVVENLRTIYC